MKSITIASYSFLSLLVLVASWIKFDMISSRSFQSYNLMKMMRTEGLDKCGNKRECLILIEEGKFEGEITVET